MEKVVVQDSWSGSEYYLSLDSENKVTYRDKLSLTNGTVLVDPFTLENWSDNVCRVHTQFQDFFSLSFL